MNYRFNFRGENNKFVGSTDFEKITKIDFVSSEMSKKTVDNINSWIKHEVSVKSKDKINWIKNVMDVMNSDKRSNSFIEKFFKSYINSSLSLKKIDPTKVYNRMIANGIEQLWK